MGEQGKICFRPKAGITVSRWNEKRIVPTKGNGICPMQMYSTDPVVDSVGIDCIRVAGQYVSPKLRELSFTRPDVYTLSCQ